MNRKIYRSGKFGSWERSQATDAQVAATGKTVDIDFRYDLQTNTPKQALQMGMEERSDELNSKVMNFTTRHSPNYHHADRCPHA